MSRNQAKHLTSVMDQPMKYGNVPPKEIQNAIWGSCFDYEDFNTDSNGTDVRDRIYQCWQIIHQELKTNPEWYAQWVANHEPDIEV